MVELAFGAAHPEWPNSIVGGHLGASTGVGGVLPKQVLAFRKGFGGSQSRLELFSMQLAERRGAVGERRVEAATAGVGEDGVGKDAACDKW
jgi:hypothetical protein